LASGALLVEVRAEEIAAFQSHRQSSFEKTTGWGTPRLFQVWIVLERQVFLPSSVATRQWPESHVSQKRRDMGTPARIFKELLKRNSHLVEQFKTGQGNGFPPGFSEV
jgi:hypothetical protein